MVNSDDTIAQILLDNGANTRALDGKGNTLLHDAAKMGCVFVIRYLLARGVDPNIKNDNEESPLHVGSMNGHRSVTHLLLAKESIEMSGKDKNGRTPLHYAAALGHYAIARELVTNGTDIDADDAQLRTPMYESMSNNHTRISQYLESRGARQPGKMKPDFLDDPPPYEMPSDISLLYSKRGTFSRSNDADNLGGPFEISVPNSHLLSPMQHD